MCATQDESQEYTVSVTYVQIYNENAYDLFSDPSSYSDEEGECVRHPATATAIVSHL